MASLGGTIDADFAEFVGECQKADAGLEQIQAQAKKTEAALDEMTTSASSGKVSDSVSKTGTEMAKVDGSANQMIGTMRSLAGAFGVAFSVEAVIGFGKEILRSADEITRLSDQTGMTVEQVQQLSYTAGQAGNTLDQITAAASKMQASLDTEKGQKAVEALGLEFQQFAAAKPYDQILQVSDALRGIADPTERAQAAVELFGESGAKILPTLASDMRAVGEAAAVSSAAQIAALDAAGDAIDRWATTAKTAAIGAAGGILLAGEQIADQGLLKTIQMWAASPTTAIFLQQMTEIRTAAKQTAADVIAADAAVASSGGGAPKETPAERAARERTEAAAKRDHEAAAKALAAAEAELKQVRLGYGGNLASMSAETLKAVQADLELGASQSTVATAYGLTTQQVKAASDELKTHLKITTGLGAEWANVGEKVTITADAIVADTKRMTEAAKAYEAETQRMVDEAQQIKPPLQAAKEETQQLTVAMNQAAGAALSVHQQMQAGMALMDAYRETGVATGMQTAMGGYQFSRIKAAGVMPTSSGEFGRALTVNVNSTEAQDIAEKLVTEMRRNGVRF